MLSRREMLKLAGKSVIAAASLGVVGWKHAVAEDEINLTHDPEVLSQHLLMPGTSQQINQPSPYVDQASGDLAINPLDLGEEHNWGGVDAGQLSIAQMAQSGESMVAFPEPMLNGWLLATCASESCGENSAARLAKSGVIGSLGAMSVEEQLRTVMATSLDPGLSLDTMEQQFLAASISNQPTIARAEAYYEMPSATNDEHQLFLPYVGTAGKAPHSFDGVSAQAIGVTQNRYRRELGGWAIQVRGPESHTLGTCVRSRVRHYNFEVFRRNHSGRWDYVVNMHIGTYWSWGRKCFVMWDNWHPWVCWKVCGPSRGNLEEMLRWMLYLAAAIIAVAIAWWVVSWLAASVGGAMFFPMLALI